MPHLTSYNGIAIKTRQTLYITCKPSGNTMARYEAETLTQTRYSGLNTAYKKTCKAVEVYIKLSWQRRRLKAL